MLNMPRATSFVMDRLVLWLGRSPTLGFAISRVAFAFAATWQIEAMFSSEPDFARTVLGLQTGIWLWTLASIAQHLASPPLGLLLRPISLFVDLIVFLSAIVLCPPLQVAALACLFFVAWSASDRFGRGSIIVLALCLMLTFLARSYYEAWASTRSVAEVDRAIDGITVLIGCTIAAAMLSMSILEKRLISWSERLQGVGVSFQKSLAAFVVEQVFNLMAARYCALVWQMSDQGTIHCEIIDAEGARTLSLPDKQIDSLLSIAPRDAPFLYASQSRRVLLRNRLGIFRSENAPDTTEAVLDVFGPGQGTSFQIQSGELRGRMFIGARHGWSPAVLLRSLRIQEGLELFLERHFFFLAWRDRTFAEARLALSHDLHDSVLQTLAALRVRLVTTIRGLSAMDAPNQLAELRAMEELVTAEQAHLRRLLASNEAASSGKVDLGVQVERCCRFISLQWGVECLLNPVDRAIIVSPETATEVEFLIREATANAVKHAAARHIVVSLAQADDEILIALKDNPGAHPISRETYTGDFELQSQSIMKRLTKVGGTAYFHNLSINSLISIRLPSSLPRFPA
ncbi:sensor histidine kinase [Sphingobium vermicomposti]|uniref:sensor histidine kinase n=1 Tax=Sphingobium vermicomposti TaxID=529005 RepID=UPI00142444A4|nr:histidine kinase [Sphingobium vermicomposti]